MKPLVFVDEHLVVMLGINGIHPIGMTEKEVEELEETLGVLVRVGLVQLVEKILEFNDGYGVDFLATESGLYVISPCYSYFLF